jgi:hypothetical protein
MVLFIDRCEWGFIPKACDLEVSHLSEMFLH